MPTSAASLSPEDLVQIQRRRYATKKFEASRKIDPNLWSALEQSLLMTPSGYGLQPWKFIVVTDPALKSRLRAASWNQPQVEECSRLVIFLAKREVHEGDVDRYIARMAEVSAQTADALAGLENAIKDWLETIGPESSGTWAVSQVHIALGNFVTSAATLGVDTCAMAGLLPDEYDRVLGLEGSGYHTVCVCSAGYRSEEDAFASKSKVRFPLEEVIEYR